VASAFDTRPDYDIQSSVHARNGGGSSAAEVIGTESGQVTQKPLEKCCAGKIVIDGSDMVAYYLCPSLSYILN